jgi:Tol biopolymer transport system component
LGHVTLASRMRVPSFRRGAGLAVLLLLVATPVVRAASVPPDLDFQTIVSRRVTVVHHRELEAMAREAAARADVILDHLEARYGNKVGRVQIVLTDTDDDPNGYATPIPYPLVNVRAVAPNGTDDFGNLESWLALVLTHELAHAVHLEPARGVVGFGRKVLGRAPYLFPNIFTPTWMIEGLAVYEETEGTAFGRGRNSDSRMVRRAAALEGAFPKEDQAVFGLDEWPGGQASYLFGDGFLRHLSSAVGPDVLPRLQKVQSRQVIPYLDDWTSSKVTGVSFHSHWKEWSLLEDRDARLEAETLRHRGLTASRALTTRGIRQTAPRFSPDGEWIAYTSTTLDRHAQIRLMRADGSEDHRLVDRNGGAGLSWTPDGRALVYDEVEIHRTFYRFFDLRVVDVGTGKGRRLTRGLRAREPDVSPDGQTIVFVRKMGNRSDLHLVGLDGDGLRALTSSPAETEWGDPRFSPDGGRVVASRWRAGGWLDVVVVDAATGVVTELTHDRAKDVEPSFTPDGSAVVFRSDRDGHSNLHAHRFSDGALLQITNVLGGAFAPAVRPDGQEIVFASYSSRGYDLHRAAFDLADAPLAPPFSDPYPEVSPPAAPEASPVRPYRPLKTVWPRFWSPVILSRSEEWQLGAATGGSDPLFRHVWGATLRFGTETGRPDFDGFYQYDRFRPTFLLFIDNDYDLESPGRYDTRSLNLRASLPVRRTLWSSQSVSFTWRRERETFVPSRGPSPPATDLGGLEAAWALSSVKQYPFSISPVDGTRLRVAVEKEDPALGSDFSLLKVTADARGYLRLGGNAIVLAARGQGGFTAGEERFRRTFAVGGFPDNNLFDLQRTNLAVLRGYPDDAFTGRSFFAGNLEARFPLAVLQRGWRTLPLFVRHLHAAVFFDAGSAWTGSLGADDVRTALGASLGADTYLGHRLPLTGVLGVARGLNSGGETSVYFRLGLAF